ncbi:MAG TPA: endonuclease NucS domain-containing protein [Albitalea sp.]|uniref:endonuclease NucS domain-containing protein n=1 Tax=Piscinibacter sp. TaxID=1903157 RepID=UPI002ED49AC7
MPRQVYPNKTKRQVMREMLEDWKLQPGQVFTASRAHEWFKAHYPLFKPGSVAGGLVQSSTNDPSRMHHKATDESDDLLFKVGRNQYRLYEPGKDPAPIRELVQGDVAREEELAAEEPDEGLDAKETGEPVPGTSEFLLERDLQRYLKENLVTIEPGLKLYVDPEGDEGFEFEAGGGRRIDLLAVDSQGGLVVLELKVSRGYDRVVGQLLRYMNWVRKELAEPGQRVRGFIICRTMTEDLLLACASISEVELFEYQLKVNVSKVPALDLTQA